MLLVYEINANSAGVHSVSCFHHVLDVLVWLGSVSVLALVDRNPRARLQYPHIRCMLSCCIPSRCPTLALHQGCTVERAKPMVVRSTDGIIHGYLPTTTCTLPTDYLEYVNYLY